MTVRKTVAVITFCTVCVAVFAAEGADLPRRQGPSLGIGLNHYAVGDAPDVGGGSYVAASLSLFIADPVIARVSYAADLAPAVFTNHLVFAEIWLRVFETSGFVTAIGPVYLANFARGLDANYVGLRLVPFSSWKSQFDASSKLGISLLPLSVLYGINSHAVLWTFSFLDIHIYF